MGRLQWAECERQLVNYLQLNTSRPLLSGFAIDIVRSSLERGRKIKTDRMKCIQHIEIELAGMEGCPIDFTEWKRDGLKESLSIMTGVSTAEEERHMAQQRGNMGQSVMRNAAQAAGVVGNGGGGFRPGERRPPPTTPGGSIHPSRLRQQQGGGLSKMMQALGSVVQQVKVRLSPSPRRKDYSFWGPNSSEGGDGGGDEHRRGGGGQHLQQQQRFNTPMQQQHQQQSVGGSGGPQARVRGPGPLGLGPGSSSGGGGGGGDRSRSSSGPPGEVNPTAAIIRAAATNSTMQRRRLRRPVTSRAGLGIVSGRRRKRPPPGPAPRLNLSQPPPRGHAAGMGNGYGYGNGGQRDPPRFGGNAPRRGVLRQSAQAAAHGLGLAEVEDSGIEHKGPQGVVGPSMSMGKHVSFRPQPKPSVVLYRPNPPYGGPAPSSSGATSTASTRANLPPLSRPSSRRFLNKHNATVVAGSGTMTLGGAFHQHGQPSTHATRTFP